MIPNKLLGDERYSHWFVRNHQEGDLRSKSIKGGVSTVIAQIISFILSISSTILLARLLLPNDYGLVAMVTSVTGFVLMFKDLGLSQAIIQKEQVNQRDVSMVFWLNVYASVALAILVLLMGPALVAFYKEPRLLYITAAYALVTVLGGISAQHAALLNRQMKFKIISRITIAASFISLAIGMTMAWYGMGYWALVAINVINTFIQTTLMWLLCNWRPTFLKIDKSIKTYVQFGAGVTGFNIVNYFSRNLDNILIGKYIGAGPLGLYSKAYQLLMLPISQLRDPLNAVGTPAMSSLFGDKEKYRKYYREYISLLAFFSMPIVVFMFVCSKPIILLVLGPNWVNVAYIFQLLAITALIQPTASTNGMVMITSGQTNRFFMWGICNAIAVVVAFIIGINWGITGIAIAYAIVNYAILIPALKFSFKNTPIKVKDFFKAIAPPFIFSILAGIAAWVIFKQLANSNLYIQIIAPLSVFGVLYVGMWWPLPHTRVKILGIFSIAKSIVKKGK